MIRMLVNKLRFSPLALALGALATFVAPASSSAAVVQFNSEAAYNAAVGSQTFFIDFNGLPVGASNGVFAGQVDFGSPEATNPDQVLFNSNAMTDTGSTIATNGVGPVDGIFDNPVSAFGLVFSSSGNPQSVELFDIGDVLLGTVSSNPGGFFGVLSDTAIARFIIRNGEFTPGNNDRYFVDDFRANAAAVVPVPGAVLLFGTALAGLFGFGWRRRSQTAKLAAS